MSENRGGNILNQVGIQTCTLQSSDALEVAPPQDPGLQSRPAVASFQTAGATTADGAPGDLLIERGHEGRQPPLRTCAVAPGMSGIDEFVILHKNIQGLTSDEKVEKATSRIDNAIGSSLQSMRPCAV
eukprot:2504284-Pyramimonas_sp.AAC.1